MKQISLLILISLTMLNTLYPQNPDFLFMVEQAVKAPSGHNTQPWLFRINDESIEIHPNLTKSLPVVDFDNRELFISLGCAAENLCIAATLKSYRPEVSTNESGVITVRLTKQESLEVDPLFGQIDQRQTNRSVYNGQRIPEKSIDLLRSPDIDPNVNLHFYKKGTKEFDTLAAYVQRGNTLQMQDRAFKEELRQWMRFNKRHQNQTNDGLSYAVFGAPNLPKFIVKPIMKNAVNEKTQNKGDRKKIESSSHFVMFTIENNRIPDWINLGRALERFLLKSTESGIIHAFLNQPVEIRTLSEEMAETLNIPHQHPAILLRLGYGEKMPYSKRKDITEVIINE